MIGSNNISVYSEKGIRPNNEDRASFCHNPKFGTLLVVADGMGGHEGGEVASEIAVTSLSKAFADTTYDGSEGSLMDAIKNAHQNVLKRVNTSPELRGMGSTMVAAVLMQSTVLVANVGDSRAYQFRADCVRRLTCDDLYISQLLGIDDRVARKHPHGHVLSQAIGAEGGISPNLSTFDMEPGDTLLLCTDGVHEVLPEPDMRWIIEHSPLSSAAEQVVAAALRAGSADNCTVIIARIPWESS